MSGSLMGDEGGSGGGGGGGGGGVVTVGRRRKRSSTYEMIEFIPEKQLSNEDIIELMELLQVGVVSKVVGVVYLPSRPPSLPGMLCPQDADADVLEGGRGSCYS